MDGILRSDIKKYALTGKSNDDSGDFSIDAMINLYVESGWYFGVSRHKMPNEDSISEYAVEGRKMIKGGIVSIVLLEGFRKKALREKHLEAQWAYMLSANIEDNKELEKLPIIYKGFRMDLTKPISVDEENMDDISALAYERFDKKDIAKYLVELKLTPRKEWLQI